MANTPMVTVSSGQLKGKYEDDGAVAVFKGIPYAEPPVGDLRWRPPQPIRPWSGIREATKFGPMAHQRLVDFETFITSLIDGQGWGRLRAGFIKLLAKHLPAPKQSEDCLYLNVRTPTLEATAHLPVMVWIHGGDHQDGGGSDIYYDSNVLPQQGVVTVSINYRLGVMGYLAHPELTAESPNNVSGNYGTLDQIAALQWVQDNIEAFGGDPNNVTIFGESAGGESIIHMMSSPLAKGLFHKAIAQSPANSGQMMHLKTEFLDFDSAESLGVRFANAVGASGDNQIEQLRHLSPDELYKVVRVDSVLGNHYPCIDGYVLPKSPFETFADGEQADVPLMIGSNVNEGDVIYQVLPTLLPEYRHREQSIAELPSYMADAFGDDLPKLLTIYPGLDKGQEEATYDFMGDYMFGARAHYYAHNSAQVGNPTYMYMFARTPPSPTQTAGAAHAAELPFVHGRSVPILPLTKEDNGLSEQMIRYWTQFAKSGDPNDGTQVEWPRFSSDDQQWLRLNHTIVAEPVTRLAQYEIFNGRTARLVEEMKALRNREEVEY